jgi:hypothetical protein
VKVDFLRGRDLHVTGIGFSFHYPGRDRAEILAVVEDDVGSADAKLRQSLVGDHLHDGLVCRAVQLGGFEQSYIVGAAFVSSDRRYTMQVAGRPGEILGWNNDVEALPWADQVVFALQSSAAPQEGADAGPGGFLSCGLLNMIPHQDHVHGLLTSD